MTTTTAPLVLLSITALGLLLAQDSVNPAQQVSYCGLWRTDGNWASTIHVKNMLVTGALDVQPILYMADGTKYELPSVHVAAAGLVNVDVNAALRILSVRPHLLRS